MFVGLPFLDEKQLEKNIGCTTCAAQGKADCLGFCTMGKDHDVNERCNCRADELLYVLSTTVQTTLNKRKPPISPFFERFVKQKLDRGELVDNSLFLDIFVSEESVFVGPLYGNRS